MKSTFYGALLLSLAACSAGGLTSSLPNNAQRSARATSSYEVVYSFRGAPDGYVPMGGLVSDDSGRLYGVTNMAVRHYAAATEAPSAAVRSSRSIHLRRKKRSSIRLEGLKTTRSYRTRCSFHNGSFYGTSQDGGTSASLGTVFKIAPPAREGGQWNETILHRFHGSPSDGSSPSQITIDATGTIYGAAGDGGRVTKCFLGCGAIFRLTPPPAGKGTWRETILHSFAGVPDGSGT